MKFGLLLGVAALVVPAAAMADNVGGCGWGSRLMNGNKGIAPQVLAVTTNGTSGNQTFGITSGTSGCTQDGVVQSNWKMSMFIDENRSLLARDISAGQGEALASLTTIIGLKGDKAALFNSLAQSNFGTIFPSADAKTADIIAGINAVLASDARLAAHIVS